MPLVVSISLVPREGASERGNVIDVNECSKQGVAGQGRASRLRA